MSVKKILSVQDSILRQKAKPVSVFDKRIQRLITDLTDTLLAQKDPVGVGLSASQIGKNVRIFIIKSGKKITPFINPGIVWKSKETNDPSPPSAEIRSTKSGIRKGEYIMEGCLSLPHYYGPVKRAAIIKVRYQTQSTNHQSLITKVKTFRGLTAQIIQHEIDHLNGNLFIDRLLSQKRKLFRWNGKVWEEVEL